MHMVQFLGWLVAALLVVLVAVIASIGSRVIQQNATMVDLLCQIRGLVEGGALGTRDKCETQRQDRTST